MDPLKLDTSCTALILVDLQRGIVGMPTSPYSGSFVVEKGASLAAALRRMYATVVYVRVDLSNMMSVAFPQALPYGLRQANYGQSSMSEMASLEYLAGAQIAGIVLGARVPIVLTSRTDKAPARLVSCAIARLLARNNARSERLGA